ncbi:MAG: LysR family transcriptional regulator, partial [Nitrospirae bacterium]|nr:LysR family transcriptional regulator [Nitrospirota bacterium]
LEDYKLRVFCTVADTKSFSRTSKIIHLTQPAVSLQIQTLEELYETKLFDRSSSTIDLTPSGHILYKYAKNILGMYTEAEKEIGKITGLIKGNITLGASTTIGNYIIPALIADFKKTHPKIVINVLIGNTRRIIDLLTTGDIDFGIVEGDVSRQKLKTEALISDELVLITAAFHPWANKKYISIYEIQKEPLIIREEGSGTRQMIEKYFASHGLNMNNLYIVMVLGGTESIKAAVENGMGVSIVSKWAARKEAKYGTLKLITPKEERMRRDFSLVKSKRHVSSHATDEFLTYLKAYPYSNLLNS